MSRRIRITAPPALDLERFADLLPPRDSMLGEAPAFVDEFRDARLASFAPATPDERLIAENLVAIEWELLQHRRLRATGLRQNIRVKLIDAAVARSRAEHGASLDAAYEEWIAAGNDEDDWDDPVTFDEDAALEAARILAARAMSRDVEVRKAALDEIADLGLEPVMLLGEAGRTIGRTVSTHEEKIQELERRRREVKRDYDTLQKVRPVEAEVTGAEVRTAVRKSTTGAAG